MKISQLFSQNKTVIADGAMGTYFSKLTEQDSSLCELYNITHPEIIRQIHSEYIEAGAALIRTNTFSANSITLGADREKLSDIISAAFNIAADCADGRAAVLADVSAVYSTRLSGKEILGEYKKIIDPFIMSGAENFLFETLSSLEPVMPAIDYILEKKPDAEIAVSFTLLPDGLTRLGLSGEALLREIKNNRQKLTAAGLNCGCGSVQMLSFAPPFLTELKNMGLYTTVMPNAGYPTMENSRTVFTSTPSYFAEKASAFFSYGVSALGGCCGTEPKFIRLLSDRLDSGTGNTEIKRAAYPKRKKRAPFSSALTENRFIIAAELDPPSGSDFTGLLTAARILKDSGVDIITVSDSPLGRAKADPVICSAKIKRETDIEVLPHICCRDRNINCMRSLLLGAHNEGIRAVLAVTGDPVAESDKGIVKPVFNIDSVRLMNMISALNTEMFADSPIAIGGAYDPDPKKTPYSLKRLQKKMNAGAGFVLTQPVFSEEAFDSIDKARETGVKVLVGIMPVISRRNAEFMKNEVPGMVIPDSLVERFDYDMSRSEAEKAGIEAACELVQAAKPHADGFYFVTPFNRAHVISEIIKSL